MHYAYDTIALAKGTGDAVVEGGGKTWYFLTADYAFGALAARTTPRDVVKAAGGNVVGSVRHPLSASDFSSFLLQAQVGKAQILGLANAGGDTINSIKAANEFGITKTMKLAGLLMFINDVHSLGLKADAGHVPHRRLVLGPERRDARLEPRFFEKIKNMPSMLQAADYSATLQYLNAVKAAGTDDADKVMAQMKQDQDQRHLRQGRRHPRRRPHGPRHVPDAGQDAGRVEGALGLLQRRREPPGRRGLTTKADSEVRPCGSDAQSRHGHAA